MKLILASTSTTRRKLLAAAGVQFEAVAAELDEEAAKQRLSHLGAPSLASALADLKASSIAADPEALVLGADQTLEREDGAIVGKPASPAEMHAQLRALSGRTHQLHTAAAIVEAGKPVWRSSETVVLRMRTLSEAFLDDYVTREFEAARGSAGGYRIEGPGAQLFDRIAGSHFAILGLPLLPLFAYLRERGILPS